MTKVKTTNRRKPGAKQPEASVVQLDRTKEVSVQRNGETTTMSIQTWDLLPPDKEGWSLVAETPKEIQGGGTKVPTAEEIEFTSTVDQYKTIFGKDPEGEMTLQNLKDAISEKEEADKGEQFEVVVTQEYLDLHPEEAQKGTKVGDTIFVKGE